MAIQMESFIPRYHLSVRKFLCKSANRGKMKIVEAGLESDSCSMSSTVTSYPDMCVEKTHTGARLIQSLRVIV